MKKVLASVIAVLLAFSVILPAVADNTEGLVDSNPTATGTDAPYDDGVTPTDDIPDATATDTAPVSSPTDGPDDGVTPTDEPAVATATDTAPVATETDDTPVATETDDTPAATETDDKPGTPDTPVVPPAIDDTPTPAAPSDDYDFERDPKLKYDPAASEAGEYAWGAPSPAIYSIVEKKVYTIAGIPTRENEFTGATEPALVDLTNVDNPEYEGVTLAAFYTFKCPECGNAVGATSVYDIYREGQGNCVHCGKLLPNPETVKIYRMIIVDPNSPHKKTMKGYDFTKVAKEVYGATAGLYGDGKDLPEQYMIYTEKTLEGTDSTYTVYSDFYTSGLHGDFKEGFMARLMLFIVRFIVWLTPRAQSFDESGYNAFVWKIRLTLAEGLEKLLSGFVSGRG